MLLISIMLVLSVHAASENQYFKQLHSISQCLSNCMSCDYNELNGCLPSLEQQCINNYYMDDATGSCVIDDVFQEQIVLINQNGDFQRLQKWETVQSTQCYYEKSSGQVEKVSVMGLFLASGKNTVKFKVQPYHQSLLISFNLIRNSWVPFLDFLQIQVKDQDNKLLNKYIIEYFQRQQYIGAQQNTITCNQQRLMVEKFQFSVDFRHKNLSQINVVFTGLMQGTQLWGFTNFKVAFGCENNLFYNGLSCLGCEPGNYLDTKTVVNGAPTCHQCLPNCMSCSKQRCFTCAEGMIPKDNHCQPAQGYKLFDKVYHPKSTICNISMLHSQSSDIHKQIIDPIVIKIPDKHEEARLIFDLYLTDTQWNNESALVIEIDGRQIKKIREDKIHNRLRQKCPQFAMGFFSYLKIVTPYFDHHLSQMVFRIYSIDDSVTDFGISDINVQIKLDYSPDQPQQQNQTKIEPTPTPPAPVPTLPVPKQSPEVVQRKQSIKSIMQKKQQVILSHNTISDRQNNGQLIVSINYPFQVSNYPYIFCHFQKLGLHLPGQMISSTHHLQLISVNITKSIVNQTVTVTMSAYNKLVASKIDQNTKVRNLQQKTDNQVQLGKIQIKRFDVLDINELSSMSSLKVMFETITIIFLILTIIFMMIGKGSVITDLSLIIQVVFLHVYINGQFQPYAFKMPASGFQNMENLNFFSYSDQKNIESFLLGNVVQESPIRFIEFNTDINFSRAIYPIIFINIIFLLWFFLLKLARLLLKQRIQLLQTQQNKAYNGKDPIKQTRFQKLYIYIGGMVSRPINYWYFILKYQYLAMVWICMLQFYGFSYPANSDRNQTINAVFCIMCFIVVFCWPIAAYLFIRHKYITMRYEDYKHEYEHIFYFQLHSRSLPSNHHQYFMLIDAFRKLMYCVCCSYIGNSPIQSLTILILIHIASIFYLKVARPIINFAYARFFYVQFALLFLLEVVMIVAFAIQQYATKTAYFALGYCMVVLCILLIINGIVRMIYMIYRMRTHDRQDRSTFQGDYIANRAV